VRAAPDRPHGSSAARDLRNEAIAWASHWLTSFHHHCTALPLAALGHSDAERTYDGAERSRNRTVAFSSCSDELPRCALEEHEHTQGFMRTLGLSPATQGPDQSVLTICLRSLLELVSIFLRRVQPYKGACTCQARPACVFVHQSEVAVGQHDESLAAARVCHQISRAYVEMPVAFSPEIVVNCGSRSAAAAVNRRLLPTLKAFQEGNAELVALPPHQGLKFVQDARITQSLFGSWELRPHAE
jgi:hypothetical protein